MYPNDIHRKTGIYDIYCHLYKNIFYWNCIAETLKFQLKIRFLIFKYFSQSLIGMMLFTFAKNVTTYGIGILH